MRCLTILYRIIQRNNFADIIHLRTTTSPSWGRSTRSLLLRIAEICSTGMASNLTINSNLASLNAQRMVTRASASLSDSFTRLSSGLRINRASDDAADLAISEALKADTRISNQGVRNFNDGLSLLSIADGALSELTNITVRLRELASQGANGVLGSAQRFSLDKEAQSLAQEYNRIARTTEFNGRRVFEGDFGNLRLAAGGSTDSLIVDDLGGAIGNGDFTQAQTFLHASIPEAEFATTAADFNGDGVTDIASVLGVSFYGVYLANADGSLNARTTFAVATAQLDIEAADYNGDGRQDFVTYTSSNDTVSFFAGNGDGTFLSAVSFATGANPADMEIADLNSDGKLDILISDTTEGTLSFFWGTGNGTFSARQTMTVATPSKLHVSDLNADGIDDILVDQGGSGIGLLYGVGGGAYRSLQTISTLDAVGLTSGDFDGDGIKDVGLATSSTVNILQGSASGTFSQVASVAGASFSNVAAGDFDGNGKTDIVTSIVAGANGGVQVYVADGTVGLRRTFTSTGAAATGKVSVADFNRDGVSDFFQPIYGTARSSIVRRGASTSGLGALQSFSLRTQNDAKNAITYLEGALTRISKQRGDIGAFQSRIQFATSTLETRSSNYMESGSRITDVDVAEESARLAGTRILQQGAAAVLAQANQQPALALTLLGGI